MQMHVLGRPSTSIPLGAGKSPEIRKIFLPVALPKQRATSIPKQRTAPDAPCFCPFTLFDRPIPSKSRRALSAHLHPRPPSITVVHLLPTRYLVRCPTPSRRHPSSGRLGKKAVCSGGGGRSCLCPPSISPRDPGANLKCRRTKVALTDTNTHTDHPHPPHPSIPTSRLAINCD